MYLLIYDWFIHHTKIKNNQLHLGKLFHAMKLRLSGQFFFCLTSLRHHLVFLWKNCSILRGCSYRTCFSRPMCYFSIVFLCTCARPMFVTIVLMSCIFYSISHMSTTFLRHHGMWKQFQLLHASAFNECQFQTMDQSEDPETGQVLQAFVGMATVLFDGNRAKEAFCTALFL